MRSWHERLECMFWGNGLSIKTDVSQSDMIGISVAILVSESVRCTFDFSMHIWGMV